MSARLCAVMKRAHLQLSDRAARTESTGSSVPPGLKESWYRDVFIFLVPTWYRSTGSFDNPNIYNNYSAYILVEIFFFNFEQFINL